jgi:uncharacterized protein with FMN-binding domain
MTRILTWLLGTAAAVALLFGYHTSTAGPLAATTETVAAAPPTTGTAGTTTGSVAQTRWGPVQVQITVQDGRITAVTVPQYPDGNGRDREINDVALPELVQETLSAQSADIDMVSGATVTSEGYLESLQSALDQVGL